MKLHLTVAFVLYACAAGADPGDYYLYAPQHAPADAPMISGANGVFVKEITIRKGDTLSAISRAFTGHASYFPQILLFNQISDPDMIYAGKTLRVPVVHAAKKQPERRVTHPAIIHEEKPRVVEPRQPVEQKEAPVVRRPAGPVESRQEKDEQVLYQKAVKAYRGETCEDALPLLDSFLKKYPESLHAPDAALLRADCHLKLSGSR